MSFKSSILQYQAKKAESIRVDYIFYTGTQIYKDSDKMLNAKILRPSMNEEKDFINLVISKSQKTNSLISYFIDIYKVEYDKDKLNSMTSMTFTSIFDCKEYASFLLDFYEQLRKVYKGPLIMFSMGNLAPLEILILIAFLSVSFFINEYILHFGLKKYFIFMMVTFCIYYFVTVFLLKKIEFSDTK